ncbi:hypothetical protein PVK06_001331 [Gossypium arboreum]|uniref:40S ribosomal protein SA n=1 Tax=Gossypium arboreum TaxID=29729 RepID=A0ABR0R0W8_GOSAR|nr:hypothetical protein PVK06_001331 [Gossypium arboreum]
MTWHHYFIQSFPSIDIGILANNKGKHNIGCLFWLLARMVLQMRGTVTPGQKRDMMVDLFFYREPEEDKQQEEEEAIVAPNYGLPAADYGMGALATDQWLVQIGDQWTADMVQPPISYVPVGNWGDQGKFKTFLCILFNLRVDDCCLCLINFGISNAVAISTDAWDAAAAPAQIPMLPSMCQPLLLFVGNKRFIMILTKKNVLDFVWIEIFGPMVLGDKIKSLKDGGEEGESRNRGRDGRAVVEEGDKSRGGEKDEK